MYNFVILFIISLLLVLLFIYYYYLFYLLFLLSLFFIYFFCLFCFVLACGLAVFEYLSILYLVLVGHLVPIHGICSILI